MGRFVCIHGHFYQPPRENPWLDEVEQQDSAYPYHDWNERITAECYAPNTASRILDADRRIVDIVNNYSKISFNFGPTLLSWMEKKDPDIYKAILEADKESRKKFSGHGSALAQCYSHMIMPLANKRDKRTQIIWGMKDFRYRFGRKPEGMWLPETAVDIESLGLMADMGIKFTILAPSQAKAVRKKGEKEWADVSGARVDPKRPYSCVLPSGKIMNLFFYDGPVAQELAFGDLLVKGENFADRIVGLFNNDSNDPQLAHIATDGETYGHHHNFGDMSLAYCLHQIESRKLADITIYGEYLEKHPSQHEVKIFENSSWSCIHGVERWRNNCGCSSGMNGGWHQEWRAPLRGALDWLRDTLVEFYEGTAGLYLKDPWKSRDDYINVILNRSKESTAEFFRKNALKELSQEEKVKVIYLMEMQRYAMLMYTSCGWFFDEISGIETVQILQYSARAIHLAKIAGNLSLEEAYVNLLERIPTNIAKYNNGAHIYDTLVKPAVVNFLRVGAHYAVASLFVDYPQDAKIYSYTTNREEYNKETVGKQRLVTGKIKLRYDLTMEESIVSFVVLHLGDHNLVGGVREFQGDESFSVMDKEVREAFLRSDISEIIRIIDRHFGAHSYSLWHLFKDEQRKIIKEIFNSNMQDKEAIFRRIKDNDYPLIQTMREFNVPFPRVFTAIIKHVLYNDIHKVIKSDDVDLEQLKKLLSEAEKWDIEFDKKELAFIVSRKVDALMEKLLVDPKDTAVMEDVDGLLSVQDLLQIELSLWKSQNILFSLTKNVLGKMLKKREEGDKKAAYWVENFVKMSEYMKVKTL